MDSLCTTLSGSPVDVQPMSGFSHLQREFGVVCSQLYRIYELR